jgi:three-Cys-motif partner protein
MANLKQGDKSYLEEHSKEKVAFYKKYLDLYLIVLTRANYVSAINIYDIFCGVGIYDGDGSKGSPVVAMESINEHVKNNKKNKPIRLLINDGERERVDFAKKYIKEHCEAECDFLAHNLKAKEIFALVIEKIKSRKKENHLVFIDPHGYKDIYKRDLVDIMEAGKSEILIFLPIHLMYRFLKATKQDEENPSYTPLRRFMTEFGLDYNASSLDEYIEHIGKAFLFEKEDYFTTTYILQANNNNVYALFFVTKHIYGLEKAVEAKWKLDELCGRGFKKKQPKSLFEEEEKEEKKENCIERLRVKLFYYLKKARTNIDIYRFALTNGFLPKHANIILQELNGENKLIFDSHNERKNSFFLAYKHYKNGIIKYKVKINE